LKRREGKKKEGREGKRMEGNEWMGWKGEEGKEFHAALLFPIASPA